MYEKGCIYLLEFFFVLDVEKRMLMSECDVTEGRCQLLYSAPEALLLRDHWKQLLLSPPLSNTVVAIAVDEAHCVFKW